MATLRQGSVGTYFGSLMRESEPLTETFMTLNGLYIFTFLASKGWSKNAICAMLGNMQAESSLNPGRWQSEDIGNYSVGYGLVQWTPASKYTNWCYEQGYIDYSEMDNNLNRILYEVENGLQWIATSRYPLSFREFTTSSMSCSELAKAFLLNYERPADQSESVQEYRASLAQAWYDSIEMTTPDVPVIPEPGVTAKTKRKYNFTLFNARKRRNEWIK